MIVIHIGLKKSGSASIQTFFAANQDAFAGLSIDYPSVGRLDRKDHHNFASELMGRKNFDPQFGSLADLSNYLAGSTFATTVLSSEMFEGLEVEHIRRFKGVLARAGQPISVVLILRDLVDLMQSSYAQKIRHGRNTYDFDEFFDKRIKDERVTYFETARNWADVFGWENLRVRLLDPDHLFNGDLVDDFLGVAGIDGSDPAIKALPRPGLVNAASGWKVLEAVRALYSGRHGLEKRHPLATFIAGSERKFDQKLMDLAAAEVGARCGWMEDRGAYMTRAQAQWALDIYFASVEALNERLGEPLPPPRDLDERGFAEREFLPDVTRIPIIELMKFYADLGAWFTQRNERAGPEKHQKRYERNRRKDKLVLTGRTVRLSDIDAAAEAVVDNGGCRIAALELKDAQSDSTGLAVVIEAPDFFTRDDRAHVVAAICERAGLDAIEVDFVPPRFLIKNSLNNVDREASAVAWRNLREAQAGASQPDADNAPRPLRIVSLADGRALRDLGANHLASLSARLGAPIHFERYALPPTSILLSDAIYLDHFAARSPDPDAHRAVADAIATLRGADIILIDDGSEIHFPATQTYPVLSHRMKRSIEADLLAFRRYRYVEFHHRLPLAVVHNPRLTPEERAESLEAFTRYFGVPVFRIASSQALAEQTLDWEYRPLQGASNGPDLSPLDPRALVDALGDWIEARADRGELTVPAGEPGVDMPRAIDPPFFTSQPVAEEALQAVLDVYDRFCIAGERSSVAFIPKYLEAAGKSFSYIPSLAPKVLAAAEPFDCLLACGPLAPVEGDFPMFAIIGAGWPTPARNAPADLATLEFRGKLTTNRLSEWYSLVQRFDPSVDRNFPELAYLFRKPPERKETPDVVDDDPVSIARKARLRSFPRIQVREVKKTVGEVEKGPWPELEGCLAVLFTARSGSTFLTRELEFVYDLGRMGETLNPAQVGDQSVADIVGRRRGQWFGFKAGLPGIVGGEFYGFFDAYLEKTSFLRLVRRDILAQAISFAKASDTGEWHAHNRSARPPTYDAGKIAKAVRKVASITEQLRRYAERTERPYRTVAYEDFATGGFSSVYAAVDALGAPRRTAESAVEHRPVEKMSDEINDAWRDRFLRDMDPQTQEIIDRYIEILAESA